MTQIDQLSETSVNISKVIELMMESKNSEKSTPSGITTDIIGQISSQFASMCDSEVKSWANKAKSQMTEKLKKIDFSINNSIFQNDFKLHNVCDPNPCINGGRCELTSYHCTECPYPTSGRHCQTVNCEKANRCWQYQNTMYKVFEQSMTWDEAYHKCESKGMRLAMPKDKDHTDFLISQLKPIFKTDQFFWFGLKNNASLDWRWIDGTPLGLYLGGKADLKNLKDERFAILWLGGGAVYWYPRSYKETAHYDHFPLCEKKTFSRF